ncbi:MAG: RadC family protein [Clostridia bacterium]|nr:RadC family protein [Clostridia bacterium]
MSLHDGHRKRMYEKMTQGVLAEHEWLEVLLYNAQPRKNTNEIAHYLLNKFRSIEGVFDASMEDLQSVPGVGLHIASYLKCLGHFYALYRPQKEETFEGRFSSNAFLPFVKRTYQSILYEVVDLYLLDADGRVMKKQGFSIDSICTVRILPEAVTEFLLTKDAIGVVMVHNHPVGEAVSSEKDDTMTKNLQMLCSMHNRLLCDHIIYAPNGVYSYYLSGKLQEISENYSISKVLGE